MTDLQAALGASQMTRLDKYVSRRHELADEYDRLLANLPVKTPVQHPDGYSGRHLYVIRLRLDDINRTRREVFESLRAKGIGVNVHYIPVHTQPFYAQFGFQEGQYPNAENYYSEAISLPLFPGMSADDQREVVAALAEALGV